MNVTDKFIYIVDSGVDVNNADLNVQQNDGTSISFVPSDNNPWTDCGNSLDLLGTTGKNHGSLMAEAAAAINNEIGTIGMAPNARIASIKVFDCSATSTNTILEDALDYLAFVTFQGDIVNLSLTFPTVTSCALPQANSIYSSLLQISSKGAFAISAAGNENMLINQVPGCLSNDPNLNNVYTIASVETPLSTSALTPQTTSSISNYGFQVEFATFSPLSINAFGANYVENSGATIQFANTYSTSMAAAIFSGKVFYGSGYIPRPNSPFDYYKQLCEVTAPNGNKYKLWPSRRLCRRAIRRF